MTTPTLTPEQLDVLLERLATDQSFRTLFATDLESAFASLPGHPELPKDFYSGCCLDPNQLAPPQAIAEAREAIKANFFGKGTFNPHMLEYSRYRDGDSEATRLAMVSGQRWRGHNASNAARL